MTTQELYLKVKSGEVTKEQFLYEVKRDPRFVSIIHISNNFEDAVNILKNKGMISESDEANPIKGFSFIGMLRENSEKAEKGAINEAVKDAPHKQKLKGGKGDKLTADDVNYYEFQKGWRHELEHTDDVDKAKEIALDHLAEDPIYYTRLQMVEYQANKKKRTDLPIEVSKKEVKDPNNQMEKVKKITNSNTGKVETHKVEEPKKNVGNKKEKPKSIKTKVMKGGPGNMITKALKEDAEQVISEERQRGVWNDPGDYKVVVQTSFGNQERIVSLNSEDEFKKILPNVVSIKKITTTPASKTTQPASQKVKLPKEKITTPSQIIKQNVKKPAKDPNAPFHDITLSNGTVVTWPLRSADVVMLDRNPNIKSVEKSADNAQPTDLSKMKGKISYSTMGGSIIDADVKNLVIGSFLNTLKNLKKTTLEPMGPVKNVRTLTTYSPSAFASLPQSQKATKIATASKIQADDEDQYDSRGVKRAKPGRDPLEGYGKYQIFDKETKKLVAGFYSKDKANEFVNKDPNRYARMQTPVAYQVLVKAYKGYDQQIFKDLQKAQDEKIAEVSISEKFSNIIREIFVKKLNEFNVMMLPQGPSVKKKELNRLLQGYQWNAPENNYQKINKEEALKKIKDIIVALGKSGEDLYHDYEPEGGDQGTQIAPGMTEDTKSETVADTKTLVAGDMIYYQGSPYEVKAVDDAGTIDANDPKTKKAIKINAAQAKENQLRKVIK